MNDYIDAADLGFEGVPDLVVVVHPIVAGGPRVLRVDGDADAGVADSGDQRAEFRP